jgi:UPF0755 protein
MGRNLILAILILIIGIFILIFFLPKDLTPGEEIVFNVEKGEGSREIALDLEKEGLINWAPLFRLYVLFTGVSGELQAGTYFLSSSMNMPEIAGKFSRGETAKIKITIPEGFTAEEIYQKLKDVADIDLNELKSLEGYLFPDTYEISYNASAEDIIEMMTDNFERKLTPDLREEINRQNKNLEDIVIMASLLEKEVKTKEEKELASGVLWKRLKIGMALQVDAAPETYQYQGLPEAPICSPGLESIMAAIYPKDSQYLYYLSTPEGETIFSRTLEEHNIAKAKYLK